MQQDRLIGAAGEGHYGAVRGWAGRPEYGNSLLVREPLAAAGVERLDLGPQPLRAAVDRDAAGRRVRPRRRHPPPPPDARRDAARRADGGDPGLARRADAPAADATIVMGDFNADPAEPAPARLRAAGFRSAYADGQRRGARGDLAVRPPGAGDGHGRRARVPRLHLGPRRRARRVGAPVLRPARSGGPDALPERPPRDRRPSSRSGRGGWPRRDRSASPIAATGGTPRRTRSRRSRRRSRSRPATASSSTSARRPTASRSSTTTRRSRASTADPSGRRP